MILIGITITVGSLTYMLVSSLISSYLQPAHRIVVASGEIYVNPSNTSVFAIELTIQTSGTVWNVSNVAVWHGDTQIQSNCTDCGLIGLRGSGGDTVQVTILARSSRPLTPGDLVRVEASVIVGGAAQRISAIIKYTG